MATTKAMPAVPSGNGIRVAFWIGVALAFGVWVAVARGATAAAEYYAAYLLELSLSVDNIFVIVLIFSYFKIPGRYQHRVLFWGILGALLTRGLFIAMGALLIERFGWIMYIFGAFLIFTGIRMAVRRTEEFDAEHNVMIRAVRRFVRVSRECDGQKFFTARSGYRAATPLFLVLMLVEFTDLLFAVDSIPAIFAVTTNPFLVYTSNVFAVLGLRSMYFLLSGMVDRFVYLKYGLAVILTFVGLKMILADFLHIPITVSLSVIIVTLAGSIAVSSVINHRMKPEN